MKVEIWSDVVCPWCYIGKRRFEEAMAAFEHADEVEVVWRAFELDPHASSTREGHAADPDRHAAHLAATFGVPLERAKAMDASMTATAAGEGLDFQLSAAVAANTALAHQVIHLALTIGGSVLQGAVKERLMRAYFTDGEAVGDPETLVRLAVEAGLDEVPVRQALQDGTHLEDVRADEAEAAALGATGVPFFVVDRRYGVAGAQPAEQLLAVLRRAWSERPAMTLVGAGTGSAGEGEACGPDGCAI